MKAETPNLTPREQEIYELLLNGVSLKEIAHKLEVSYKAVDYHRGNLYRKFGVKSIHELLAKHISVNNIELTESVIEKTHQNITLPFTNAVFTNWITCNDDLSSIDFTTSSEIKDGQKIKIYNISGSQYKKNGCYAGVFGFPDYDTRKALKSMSMFSFNVLGDGNEYLAMLPTIETIQGDHYFKKFSTKNGEIINITVRIDDELVQWGWSGIPLEFVQKNISYLQFQSVSAGAFNIKIWDIKLY